MWKNRIHQMEGVYEKEFSFFEGCINALLMVSPFWIVITEILLW